MSQIEISLSSIRSVESIERIDSNRLLRALVFRRLIVRGIVFLCKQPSRSTQPGQPCVGKRNK